MERTAPATAPSPAPRRIPLSDARPANAPVTAPVNAPATQAEDYFHITTYMYQTNVQIIYVADHILTNK